MKNYLDGKLGTTRVLIGVHVRGHKGKQSKCVGNSLRGKKFGSREAVQAALSQAARACGGRRSSGD
jgi:hypothetical protein